jgi:hypothetical protein
MHSDANDALLLAAYAHHAVVVLSPGVSSCATVFTAR